MYPWFGATPGYSTTASIAASIPMPDFGALGIQAQRRSRSIFARLWPTRYDLGYRIG
jgi:hypothetical protein